MLLKTWIAPNFGDAANTELVKLITGYTPQVIQADCILDNINYLIIGSTLKFGDNNSIVWGAGFQTKEDKFQDFKPVIKSVRGPKTRDRLLELGFECPEVYGDPVLLFPRYYKPVVEKKYILGIVIHHKDEELDVVKNMVLPEGVIKIRHDMGTYEFIDTICSCENIASSSLHGIIVADAYGIPAIQIKFNDSNIDNFKFEDYYMSVSRPMVEPLLIETIVLESILSSFYEYKINIDLDKLFEACPFSPFR